MRLVAIRTDVGSTSATCSSEAPRGSGSSDDELLLEGNSAGDQLMMEVGMILFDAARPEVMEDFRSCRFVSASVFTNQPLPEGAMLR